jgi:hypothetical protein
MTRRDFVKPAFSLRYAPWKHMPYRFWGLLDSCLAANEALLSNKNWKTNARNVQPSIRKR